MRSADASPQTALYGQNMTDIPVPVRQPDCGEKLRAPVGSYVIRLSGEQTGGALAIVEYAFPPGSIGAGPHIHRGHSEHFHILDGQVTFDLGGTEVAVAAGGSVSVPIGAAHGFRNASGDWARCLFLLTPAGYEGYFREVDRALAAGGPLDAGKLAALRARYATDTL
jgi:quercetin dioxygenase-like cupin family protein